MNLYADSARKAENEGSLIEGVVIGLTLEVGITAMLALAVTQLCSFAWLPQIAPSALLLVAGCAFAFVLCVCTDPLEAPFRWIVRRRVVSGLMNQTRAGLDSSAPLG